eukprot:1160390-Pelagomonas_calceolata.AAC.1
MSSFGKGGNCVWSLKFWPCASLEVVRVEALRVHLLPYSMRGTAHAPVLHNSCRWCEQRPCACTCAGDLSLRRMMSCSKATIPLKCQMDSAWWSARARKVSGIGRAIFDTMRASPSLLHVFNVHRSIPAGPHQACSSVCAAGVVHTQPFPATAVLYLCVVPAQLSPLPDSRPTWHWALASLSPACCRLTCLFSPVCVAGAVQVQLSPLPDPRPTWHWRLCSLLAAASLASFLLYVSQALSKCSCFHCPTPDPPGTGHTARTRRASSSSSLLLLSLNQPRACCVKAWAVAAAES